METVRTSTTYCTKIWHITIMTYSNIEALVYFHHLPFVMFVFDLSSGVSSVYHLGVMHLTHKPAHRPWNNQMDCVK